MGGCVLAFMAVVCVKTVDRLIDQQVAGRQTRPETLAAAEAAKDGIDLGPTGSIKPDRAAHVALDPCKGSVASDIGLRP